MARRRKGQLLDGWLVIDKPSGLGSTDVVRAAKRALRPQKVGHAGTLDPLATGLLALAFGEATKAVSVAMDGSKTYSFTVAWGAATESDDAEGQVIAESAARPTAAEIQAALPSFIGVIEQRPPGLSAIKVAGRRAYALARETGTPPVLPPRPITMHALSLKATPSPDRAEFEMRCGKGGYVRAIARDLGEALGCLGHVAALRRTTLGPFRLAHAISFEKLLALGDSGGAEEALLPVAAGLDDIPAFDLDGQSAAGVRMGRAAPIQGVATAPSVDPEQPVWVRHGDEPIALGKLRHGWFKPSRVFNSPSGPEAEEPPATDDI